MELKLHSPVASQSLVFVWPTTSSNSHQKNTALDIIETIKWVCEDFPELRLPLNNNILVEYNVESYESMKHLCNNFNKLIKLVVTLKKGTTVSLDKLNKLPSKDFLGHIMEQAYKSAVTNPTKLNQYRPFSSQAYGETSFDLVWQIICQLDVTHNDVFVDLGSGIGQVVMQVAAQTNCKHCYGIEKADIPYHYSQEMDKSFKKYMKWYGKKFTNYSLIKGDFLTEQFRHIIKEGTIIFVNNFMFGPKIDHKLKEIFADLMESTKIVSFKNFCPLNFRITKRNIHDIGTILRVSKLTSNSESVSWTGKPVSYYIHVIDRTNLQKFLEKISSSVGDISSTSDDTFLPESDESSNISSSSTSSCDSKFPKKIKPEKYYQPKDIVTTRNVRTIQNRIRQNEVFPQFSNPLNNLLESFHYQYIQVLRNMATPSYKATIKKEVKIETERSKRLRHAIKQLEEENLKLKNDGVALLKARLKDVELKVRTPQELFKTANEMTLLHKNLHVKVRSLEDQITYLLNQQTTFLEQRLSSLENI